MKIEGKIILPHVYVLKFKTRYELCMSFVRMQEFYESPKFRGKYFTLEDYIDYWCKNLGHGSFTYPAVWNGFNVPGNIIGDWDNRFNDKREKEQLIMKEIHKMMYKEHLSPSKDIDKIYVIGIHGEADNKRTLQHEIAHAMYYFNTDYRRSCKKLLNRLDKKVYKQGKKWLLSKGYCKKMVDDELQAYYSTGELVDRADFENNFRVFNLKKKSSAFRRGSQL